MKISAIYIVRKGLTETNINYYERLRGLLKWEKKIPLDLNGLVPEDELILDPNQIPGELIPRNIYKNIVKKPKPSLIDILAVFQQEEISSKPVRFKQPDSTKQNESESKDLRIKIRVPKIQWAYSFKTDDQIKSWYNATLRDGLSGFQDEADFIDWYSENVQDKKCFYCGLTERESQKIVHNGLLTSLRFPIYKNVSRGVNRGYWLEIDRKNPIGLYSRKNCNPSCYFCNNDKSDVFTDTEYLSFKENRSQFLKDLLKK